MATKSRSNLVTIRKVFKMMQKLRFLLVNGNMSENFFLGEVKNVRKRTKKRKNVRKYFGIKMLS